MDEPDLLITPLVVVVQIAQDDHLPRSWNPETPVLIGLMEILLRKPARHKFQSFTMRSLAAVDWR